MGVHLVIILIKEYVLLNKFKAKALGSMATNKDLSVHLCLIAGMLRARVPYADLDAFFNNDSEMIEITSYVNLFSAFVNI